MGLRPNLRQNDILVADGYKRCNILMQIEIAWYLAPVGVAHTTLVS
jgi:hypothetical protein